MRIFNSFTLELIPFQILPLQQKFQKQASRPPEVESILHPFQPTEPAAKPDRG